MTKQCGGIRRFVARTAQTEQSGRRYDRSEPVNWFVKKTKNNNNTVLPMSFTSEEIRK